MNPDTAAIALQGLYAALAGSRGQGTQAALVGTLSGLQTLRNVIDACETEAMGQLGAIEIVAAEDGTDAERHHAIGHQEMDAPEIVAPCLGVSVQVASSRMLTAVHQLTRTPQLVEEMAAGRLDGYRARVITDELADAPVSTAAAVVAELCAQSHAAGGWRDTAGPLRRRTAAVLAQIDEAVLAARVKKERSGRGLSRRVESSGMDKWEGFYPIEESRLAWEAIDVIAKQLLAEGSADNLFQARSDAHMKLLLGQVTATIHLHPTHPAARAATGSTAPEAAGSAAAGSAVGDQQLDGSLHAPSEARDAAAARSSSTADADLAAPSGVAESAPAPASAPVGPASSAGGEGEVVPLSGFGGLGSAFIPGDWLHQGREDGQVVTGDPLLCHPDTGAALAIPPAMPVGRKRPRNGVGEVEERYRPSERLRALIQMRDGTCRFPGCQVRATLCDLDHVIPWPVGPTAPGNLIAVCRRHHQLKQRPHWRVKLAPDGTVTWWYPDGRQATTVPVDHLAPTRPLLTDQARDVAAIRALERAATAAAGAERRAGRDQAADQKMPRATVQCVPDTPYDLGEHSPLLERLTRQVLDHGVTPGRRVSRERWSRASAEHWERHLRTTPVPTMTVGDLTVSLHTRRQTLSLRDSAARVDMVTCLYSYDEAPF